MHRHAAARPATSVDQRDNYRYYRCVATDEFHRAVHRAMQLRFFTVRRWWRACST